MSSKVKSPEARHSSHLLVTNRESDRELLPDLLRHGRFSVEMTRVRRVNLPYGLPNV
jgi:hypothetical protein